MRARGLLAGVVLFTTCFSALASAEDVEDLLAGQPAPPPPFLWRQVLSIPNIGGRIRALEVDPRDPDRIFVGTEEGTVLRTVDGGVTWRELEVKPFVIKDRQLQLSTPGLPQLGATVPDDFVTLLDPPWFQLKDRISVGTVADPFPVRPESFFAGVLVTSGSAVNQLLSDVITSRYYTTIPVWRIRICPGAQFPLIVATKREVHGSFDDGLTYIRLFANPGRTDIDNVTCSPDDPNHMTVATSIGAFISRDGGLSWDQDLTAWPGQRATALDYAVSGTGDPYLYVASGTELFAGNPDSREGLSIIYPVKDPKTAPWLPIRWIAAGKTDVWLATDDGVRVSRDRGQNWEKTADTLFSRQTFYQVALGKNEFGGDRVAVMLNHAPSALNGRRVSVGLHDSMVYATDDGGKTWHPFFYGLSRRTYHMMNYVPPVGEHTGSWWIATSGEVWTTAPIRGQKMVDEAAMKWARQKADATPNMRLVIDLALQYTALSNQAIYGLAQRHRTHNWIPRFDLAVDIDQVSYARFERNNDVTGEFSRYEARETTNFTNVFVFGQLQWDLHDLVNINDEIYPTKNRLHELRRQIAFAVEDVWHERMMHLETIARGLSDPIQIGALRVRVEGLEKLLHIWTGRTMPELEATPLEAIGG